MENNHKTNSQVLKDLSIMMINSKIEDFTLEVKETHFNTPGNAILNNHKGFITIMNEDKDKVITEQAFDNHYSITRVIVEIHEPVTRGNKVGIHKITDVYIFE